MRLRAHTCMQRGWVKQGTGDGHRHGELLPYRTLGKLLHENGFTLPTPHRPNGIVALSAYRVELEPRRGSRDA